VECIQARAISRDHTSNEGFFNTTSFAFMGLSENWVLANRI
jgi:hypothetical protein